MGVRNFKNLDKIQFTKKIIDIRVGLQIIKAHFNYPWPVLSVFSSNSIRGDQEYPEPEVNNLENPRRNIIYLRKSDTHVGLVVIKDHWDNSCPNLSVLNSIKESSIESIHSHVVGQL